MQLSDLLIEFSEAFPYTGAQVMESHARKDPWAIEECEPSELFNYSAMLEMEAWERVIVQKMKAAIVLEKGHLTLVSDKMPHKDVLPEILDHQTYYRLKLGLFEALDYRLKDFRDYDGASVWIKSSTVMEVRKKLPRETANGRPVLPAKAWYAKRNFQRGGLTMKQLQQLMDRECGKAPAQSTIAGWEREAKSAKI
ncbi:MAG: hypothetical protein V4712_12480 [Pseudomonadota bacterium]